MRTFSMRLFDDCKNELTGFIHDEDEDDFKRPCVIVCPGGGYRYITAAVRQNLLRLHFLQEDLMHLY